MNNKALAEEVQCGSLTPSLWEFLGAQFENGLTKWAQFSQFVPPFLDRKKHECVILRII